MNGPKCGREENLGRRNGITRRGMALVASLAAIAASAVAADALAQDEGERQPALEEKYARRFPQRIHVSDVLGKAILHDDFALIGYVQSVVRTGDGKIEFIVPYDGLFGFGQRLVAVPIEALASIGTSLIALDMPEEEFRKAPTWYGRDTRALSPNEVIRVAVTRL
jgi:hypothetical protein